MSVKASAVRFNVDGANMLRAESEAAITAATPSAAKSLGLMTAQSYNGELAAPLEFAIVIYVTAIDKANGDETYKIEVETALTEDYTFSKVISTVYANAVGQIVIPIAKEQMEAAGPCQFVRLKVTPAGTTPSIDYWAFLAPMPNGH